MKLKIIEKEFSICKVKDLAQIDWSDEFCFVAKTDEELSLVCSTEYVPDNYIECVNGWRAFRIQGILDFSMIGILSKITALLANEKIGLFAISTFNTDYILVKKEELGCAMGVLENAGYVFVKE